MEHTNTTVDTFKMWDYPLFALCLGYVWIELINPIAAWSLQVVPKVPNSAILVVVSYFLRPHFIKQIKVPFNPVRWTLPFLIIATINLPFIELEKTRSIIELTSTWFWVVLFLPIMVRVLATRSGRWHFLMFSTMGIVVLSLQYSLALSSYQFSLGEFDLTYHHITPGAIALIPIIIAYIYTSQRVRKYFLIVSLIILFATIIPAGSRSMWLIIPVELLLLIVFVLPRGRVIISAIVIGIIFSLSMAFINIDEVYSFEAMQHFQMRLRKTTEWQEDITIYKRMGVYNKVGMILADHPFLGVGYSNRSFSTYKGGDIELMGRLAKVRQIDAHNTYINILGGTGILGFLAFIYFMWKVIFLQRQLEPQFLKRIDVGPFIISITGTFIWYMLNTHPFSHIVQTTGVLIALYVYAYNITISEQTEVIEDSIN